MKKRTDLQETSDLTSRWVMLLAHSLMEHDDLSRQEAMQKAHLTEQLLSKMGEGVVTFEYQKEDGSIRMAKGTLRHGIDSLFDEYKCAGKRHWDNANTDGTYHYWDMMLKKFRSFKASRLISINSMTTYCVF